MSTAELACFLLLTTARAAITSSAELGYWFVTQVRAGEGTALCAKDWKVVRHEVDVVLWKVLGSESLETVSDVLSLWKLIIFQSD